MGAMTTAMVDYYGDMHASEAIDIERWTREKDGKDSPPTVVAILLYGSWNVRVASANCGAVGCDNPTSTSRICGGICRRGIVRCLCQRRSEGRIRCALGVACPTLP